MWSPLETQAWVNVLSGSPMLLFLQVHVGEWGCCVFLGWANTLLKGVELTGDASCSPGKSVSLFLRDQLVA